MSPKAMFLGPYSFLFIHQPLVISHKITPFYIIWFSNNHFMLSLNKSELIFVGSLILLSKSNLSTEVAFDGTNFCVKFKLKILGVTLYLCFNFTHFASQIIQLSKFHLHAIKQVHKFLPFKLPLLLLSF